MHWWNDSWHMGGMWGGWLLVLLIVAFVVWMFTRGCAAPRPPPESPEEILKRRYASGELDRDEYERMLADLRR